MGQRVSLRPATRQDLDDLYRWRCDPEVYRWFREQDGPLEWFEHVEWWQSRPEDREDYVIELGERPVGAVAIAADGDVGIYVGETGLWGRGIGSRAPDLAMARTDREDLHAEIHRDNERSHRLFESPGFEPTDSDGEWVTYRY